MTTCARDLVIAMCAVGILLPSGTRAQTGDLVSTGARVRVVAVRFARLPTIATVAGWRGDSLLLDVSGGPRLPVSLASIASLEVSRGRKSKLVTGAVVGLGVGTAATAAFLGMFCNDPDTLCEADEVWRAFVLIALPTSAAGALIGAAVRVERWEPVPLARLRTGSPAGPPGSRLRVGVTLRR